jgi:UDP-glucose 4-epimerase
MRILITGSEGIVAQQVIPLLILAGHTIIGVDNLSKHGTRNKPNNYDFIEGDLTDSVFTNSLFTATYDYVFHFAAIIYGVVGYNKNTADMLSKNVSMTSNILNNHKSIGKLIYISSSMVYERSEIIPSNEQDTDNIQIMTSSYGLSKYVCERLVLEYNTQYDLDYLIWRPFNIFDIKEKVHKEVGMGHVFSDLFKKIVIDRQAPLELLGNGEQTRSFIDIRDASYAIATFSFFDVATNNTYNLGVANSISIKELAHLIADTAKRHGMLPKDYQLHFKSTSVHKHDVKNRAPDTSKLISDFAWEPKITIDESISIYLSNSIYES